MNTLYRGMDTQYRREWTLHTEVTDSLENGGMDRDSIQSEGTESIQSGGSDFIEFRGR